jgi:DNA repair ATPase RecN
MGRQSTETTTAETSALESLRSLTLQHREFGQRLASIAQRVETEMEDLKTEAQTCAAELDEARAEHVELRAALEIEKAKRTTAEARIGKLESHVRRMQASCDEVLAEGDKSAQASQPAVEAEASQNASMSAPLSQALGVTAPVFAAIETLTAMKGAASPEEMVRILLLRELENAGLMPEEGPASGSVEAGREETPIIGC